jgi:hypothetical protein
VRHNGQVYRYPLNVNRPRPSDNQWTFGKLNVKTGYMEIASVRVHRIVATAFHGNAPTPEHVVDHKDTNKLNNRPENLRWVTRLENILLNPITSRRIEIVCGSVEAFLADRSAFKEKFSEPNYSWMCAVSKKEAAISLQQMTDWAMSDKVPVGGKLGEWIFDRSRYQNADIQTAGIADITIMSKTVNAVQRNWKTPSEFPNCPQEISNEPIKTYLEQLKVDSEFSRNDYGSSFVKVIETANDLQSFYVISASENAIKEWALAQVTYEDDRFVHTAMGTFFEKRGAEKHLYFELGIEWNGGEGIDDYC